MWLSVLSIGKIIVIVVGDGTADCHQVPAIAPDANLPTSDGHPVQDGLTSRRRTGGGRADATGDDELCRQPSNVVVDRVVPPTARSVL